MNTKRVLHLSRFSTVILLLLSIITCRLSAFAQGTTFTYQGDLNAGANGVTGLYDLTFALYNANTGGSQIGSTQTKLATGVTNGLFTVSLDFGAVFNGTQYWLEIGVRTNGVGSYVVLSPRQQLTPTPYAIYSETAGQANGVAAGTVSATGLNSLDSPSAGQVLAYNGSGLIWTNPSSVSLAWSLTGNAGTSAGLNFLGTTDNQPFELHAWGNRALQLSYASRTLSSGIIFFGFEDSINVLGGYWDNSMSNGVVGATIAGGGYIFYPPFVGSPTPHPNIVTNDFGSIGGGSDNTSAFYSTVPGGYDNRAFGDYSFAAGRRA